MYPVVFTIPYLNWPVSGYGLMMMCAFLASIYWAYRRAERSGANPDVILNLGFVAIVSGVVGARSMYVIHNWDAFSNRSNVVAMILSIIVVRQGGLEYYGGFTCTVVCVLLWLKFVEKVSLRWYLDISAPSSALGLALGRIGCLFKSCCYGAVCTLPWALSFPYGSAASQDHFASRLNGAALPRELLVETSGTVHMIARESIAASDSDIEAAIRAEA